MHLRRLTMEVVAGLLCIGAGLRAQVAQAGPVPIKYLSYIGVNPLGIPFDIATAEIESAIAPGVTMGAVGSYASLDDWRYTTADAKLRFYPGGVVLKGLSLGATAGVTHYRREPHDGDNVVESLTAPTIGVVVDYNWLVGADHRFVIGTGAGLKRIVANSDDRARLDLDRVGGTARFILGYAF